MNMREYALALENARKLTNRIMKQMELEDALPENPIARKAMQAAIELLALNEAPTKDRLATIRTLLEYNMAKPASTANLNVKTAEDFLDELAAE
jgi:hypothetical protein